MSTGQKHPPNYLVDALVLLPIPGVLSTGQSRGAICVWGGESLAPGTSVDLSARVIGDGTSLFPRSCSACFSRVAMQTLLDHADACPVCKAKPLTDDPPACTESTALYHLAVKGPW